MSTSNTTQSLFLSPSTPAIDTYEGFVGTSEERGQVTIDTLPDDVLLAIFDLYRRGDIVLFDLVWDWEQLAHVCRRWRGIIFASPQRLELRVICDGRTPTRTSLDIWPLFPIAVRYPQWVGYHTWTVQAVDDHEGEELENVTAALENRDRITHIHLADLSGSALRRFIALMLEPFEALTHIVLHSNETTALVLPETFLGGSAPRLRSFDLHAISFPSLPRLFVSSNLVHLSLEKIPTSGYISPETMAAYLAPLSNLKTLFIGFSSPRPRPNQPTSPPLARIILPALTHLSFQGVSEYLEDLISRIDTPALDDLDVHFFLDLYFHIPQLNQLIARIEKFQQPNRAEVLFYGTMIGIHLTGQARLSLTIHCDKLDYQVSSMTQVCHELSPSLAFVEKLDIDMTLFPPTFPALQSDMDFTQWLEFFHPFIAVQNLRVMKDLASLIAPALQDLTGDRTSEVLPALRDLHLEGMEPSDSQWEAIQPFITARRLSDHPVVIEFGGLSQDKY